MNTIDSNIPGLVTPESYHGSYRLTTAPVVNITLRALWPPLFTLSFGESPLLVSYLIFPNREVWNYWTFWRTSDTVTPTPGSSLLTKVKLFAIKPFWQFWGVTSYYTIAIYTFASFAECLYTIYIEVSSPFFLQVPFSLLRFPDN